MAALFLILALCQGGLYAQEQPKKIFVTLKPSDVSCVKEVKFFSESRQMPLNASRIDGKYVLGPLQVGEVVEVSIKPSRECYVEGILEEARLKVYRASVDTATGVGTVIISPTYNGSYTLLLHKYSKIYLIILANPPKCLAGIESDKPVKQLGEGYYRVGPWLIGGPRRDTGDLKIEVAEGCRLQKWEGPYEFTSQYQKSTMISGITPEKNMTLTAIFENVTAAGPMAVTTGSMTPRTTTKQTREESAIPAVMAFFQTPLGRAVIASPFVAVACYASMKAVRWVKKRREEKRRQREDALRLLCMMERSAASMEVGIHPWLGVFNLMAKRFTLEDMMLGLANMPKIGGGVDAMYLTEEPRCVQHLIQLKERLKNKYEEEGRGEDADRVDQVFEPAIAGYLALVGAMPVGRICEQLLDEAMPLAQRFEALDKLSRLAAVSDVMEGFTSIARRWIRSHPLQDIGRRLKRMLINSGAWELCDKPPKRFAEILEAVAGSAALREVGLVVAEAPAQPPKAKRGVVEAIVGKPVPPKLEEKVVEEVFTCPNCGERIPKQLWERLSYCPACGAPLKKVEKEGEVEKLVGERVIEEAEEARFEVKWVYEDELGKLCPLCGGELKETMEGRACYRCKILYKIKRRPVADVEEEEAWVLRIPEEVVRDPGVKVIVLKDYPYNLPATFTIKCEGFEATIYREPAKRGIRTEEFVENLMRSIERDAQTGRCSIIAMTRPGTDPWSRKAIYLERVVSLTSTLAHSPPLMKRLRLIIVVPEETIFFKDVIGELRKRFKEFNVEFQEYVVELPYEEILENAKKASITNPEQIVHLLRAFPRVLRHLRRGKTLPEAVKIELASEGEDVQYIINAVEKFHRLGGRLTEEEVKESIGIGGVAWVKLQTLKALDLVG